MEADWEAEIDHQKSKLAVTYTDRRVRPYQHLSVEIDGDSYTITTKTGSTIDQRITLRNKSLKSLAAALELIDCPETQRDLVMRIVGTLLPAEEIEFTE